MEFFATAAFGIEGIVRDELEKLGIHGVCENGGVRFSASTAQAFSANLWLRTADRVLLIAGEKKVLTFDELFEFVAGIRWEDYLPKDAAFHVTGKCARSQLMSVRDCQSIAKKAIAERMKRYYKIAWCPETGTEYRVDVAIHGDVARITLDTSGDALNRRGYRTWNGEAPLRETLAAALVMLSPWQHDQPLHDPCCGSGTLLVEAAYLRASRAPGLTRAFACENWPLFPQKQMKLLREEAKAKFDPSKIIGISGSDIDPKVLSLCKLHLKQAGLGGRVTVFKQDLRTLQLSSAPLFLCNPPYGERLGDQKSCEALYRDLRALRDRHPGSRLAAITAHTGFERCFGQRAAKKRRLYNGRLECEFLIY